ncbi:MAG TPA: hypothetical protein DEG43_13455 [Acidimicrobiaceae bacterium]|nr:hypothetical protein [Acidimicrobiaceae bacterium]
MVDVTVVEASDREVVVKLADGRLGVIPKSEFSEGGGLSGGTVLKAAVLSRQDSSGRVMLSHSWAVRQLGWEAVRAAHESKTPMTGRVVKPVKGGFVVDLGVRAFLPSSMVDEAPLEDSASLVGSEIAVMVTECEEAADRLVVSRRDALRRERRVIERAAFDRLAKGQRRTGRVVGFAEFGLMVEVEGARGLVHRSELSWMSSPSPTAFAKLGDEFEVLVLDVNKSKRRIGLSIRQCVPNPLDAIEVGAVYQGTVSKIVDYGVFVVLEDSGLTGLVHLSQLTEMAGYRPEQLVTRGDSLVVKVLSIDPKKHRVSLSVTQAMLL